MAVVRTKNLQRLGYRRIVQLLISFVIVPTTVLLSLGIVTMFLGENSYNLTLGILMVSVVLVMLTGVVLILVFVRREANLSELQADFVSKVSHELRTPLTAIRLFAETLDRNRGDAAQQDKCVSALRTETERLSDRIERLLDWGRMEAGRKQYELRPSHVRDIVEGAIASFSPLRVGEVDLAWDVAPDLPLVFADRHALADALLNLLSNALKYGGTPPSIRLRAFAEGPSVVFEVADNGLGIPRTEQRRIFQKFYRIDDRLSRAREGSGLGLAIVEHIVRAHRGSVSLDSERGRGSTFRMIVPAATAKALAAHRSAPPSSPAPPHPGQASP